MRFTAASTLYNVVTMVCSIVVLRWLPPETLGVWQSVLIVQTYLMIAQGGIITGLGRELPFLMGAQKDDEARALAGSAQTLILYISSALLAATPLVMLYSLDSQLKLALVAILPCSAMNLYQIYLGYTYRGSKAFDSLSNIMVIDSILALLTLSLVRIFSYHGLIARYVILVIITTWIRHLFRPLKNLPRFNHIHITKLFKTGFPIFLSEYLLSTVNTFPRLILLKTVGVLAVGMYAPASAILGLMAMLPVTLSRYMLPLLSYWYGQHGDRRSLWLVTKQTACAIPLLGMPIALIAWPIIPILLTKFFPQYAPSAQAARWCTVAGLFIGTGVIINALYTIKAWRLLLLFSTVNTVASIVLPVLVSRFMEDPLEGVTLGFTGAQAIAFITALFAVKKACFSNDYSNETDLTP